MKRNNHKSSGQSTLELAMLLPILFGLLFAIITAFRTNHEASDRSLRDHADVLKLFDHGNNPNPIVIDGVEIIPGRLIEIIPPNNPFGFGDFLKGIGLKSLAPLALNAVLSKIPTDTYVEGFAKGAAKEAGSSYLTTGEIDSKAAGFAGLAGALTTNEANEDFHRISSVYGPGHAPSAVSPDQLRQDFWGGALQNGMIAGAKSQGNWKNAAAGAVGSMVNSPLAGTWFSAFPNDALSGAAKGAITSTVAGVFSGHFDLKQVGISTAMGGFTSTTVAEVFTRKEGEEAYSSIGYLAARASFGTLISGGNLQDAAKGAAMGAAVGMWIGVTKDVPGSAGGMIKNIFSNPNAKTVGAQNDDFKAKSTDPNVVEIVADNITYTLPVPSDAIKVSKAEVSP